MRDINILVLSEDNEAKVLVENILKHKNFNCIARDLSDLNIDIDNALSDVNADAIIVIGGIGLSKKDKTREIVKPLLDKEIESFNSIFSIKAIEEIGVRAGCYNLLAGIKGEKVIFCLPKDLRICGIAVSQVIIYQLLEIIKQIRG